MTLKAPPSEGLGRLDYAECVTNSLFNSFTAINWIFD